MAFGQPSGPPATARQVQDLTALIHAAGHSDFRDARGPLGLTQRQAGGKFTRDEAEDLIAQLESEAELESPAQAESPAQSVPGGRQPVDRRELERRRFLDKLPDDELAAELQRRGWVVIQP